MAGAAVDLEAYALAALYILGPGFVRTLPDRAARFARPPTRRPFYERGFFALSSFFSLTPEVVA